MMKLSKLCSLQFLYLFSCLEFCKSSESIYEWEVPSAESHVSQQLIRNLASSHLPASFFSGVRSSSGHILNDDTIGSHLTRMAASGNAYSILRSDAPIKRAFSVPSYMHQSSSTSPLLNLNSGGLGTLRTANGESFIVLPDEDDQLDQLSSDPKEYRKRKQSAFLPSRSLRVRNHRSRTSDSNNFDDESEYFQKDSTLH